jgi:2-dehydro-3-deoxy-D-gluconate 5-dehydrogenase
MVGAAGRAMTLFDLTGRVAVVTGGNGGIGFGIARGLADAGAAVVVAGRREEKNAEAVKALERAGAKVSSFAGDLKEGAACCALMQQAVSEFGRLAEWHEVLDTNLTSAFACSCAARPHMVTAGGGKIINIGSMLSIFGASFAVAYGASKGGIVQMTKGLATAWAKDNIQANAILPGWIDTEFTRTAREQVTGLNERVLARTPAGRWGTPDDFAGVAVFLASAASGFVTGTVITVDGGFSVQG